MKDNKSIKKIQLRILCVCLIFSQCICLILLFCYVMLQAMLCYIKHVKLCIFLCDVTNSIARLHNYNIIDNSDNTYVSGKSKIVELHTLIVHVLWDIHC